MGAVRSRVPCAMGGGARARWCTVAFAFVIRVYGQVRCGLSFGTGLVGVMILNIQIFYDYDSSCSCFTARHHTT
eukprot:scaffold100469_cov32-Tisochrysis_lutea.AAC.1